MARFRGCADELAIVLERMGDALAHRGPDGEGTFVDLERRTGLTCRRLALVGLADGRQPVANEDGSVVAVVNGEIYDHAAVRRRLEGRGHRFAGHSDAEVVVHLYEDLGERCLEHVDGMFALALFDRRRDRVLLARDGAGMKSLCYSVTDMGIAFASEAKALFKAGLVTAQPDWDAIDTFLAVGFVPAPKTCFAGVHKLPAGHYLVLEGDTIRERAFSAFGYTDEAPPQQGGYSRELEARLRSAVRSHASADVPVGVFLSGGWDSSLLAAFAAQEAQGPLRTFSIVLPEHPSVDEATHSRHMAAWLGSDHVEVAFGADDVPRLLPVALWHREEPSPGPALLEYQLAASAAGRVKAVLSGQGSDELFGGYPWYRKGAGWYAARRAVPPAAGRALAYCGRRGRWRDGLRVLGAAHERAADAEWTRTLTVAEKRHIGMPDGPDLSPYLLDDAVHASCRDRLQRRMALDMTRRLADGLLITADRMSMAHGLEVRMPFLDRSVVEFAQRLPPSLAVEGDQGKVVLAPLARRHLPPSIATRRKRGLQYPVAEWLRGPLREYVRGVLLDSPAPDVVDRRAVESLVRRWSTMNPPNVRAPWALLVLQVWWNVFFTPGS